MEEAFGYIRCSRKGDEAEGSPDMQLERIKTYCRLQGLKLKNVYVDNGVSGDIPLSQRNGGREMLEELVNGSVMHIVSFKLDRLFRNTIDCLQMVDEWDKTGISLHLLDLGGQTLNTGSAFGKFFISVIAAVAELERGFAVERNTAIKKHQKEIGKYRGGPLPFGYISKDKEVFINEAEAQMVRRMFRLKNKGISQKDIAASMGVSEPTLSKMLNNEAYWGDKPGIPAIIEKGL